MLDTAILTNERSSTNPVEEPDRALLTSYEIEQIREIANWKSEPPNALSELWKRLTLPGASLIERVIPDRWVVVAIEKCCDLAENLSNPEEIKCRASVDDLIRQRLRPLEECDRLAEKVARRALALGTIEGALTGAGGFLTTIVDIPLLFVLSVRTILRIGYCYGYRLDGPGYRQYVLGVLITAVAGSAETRRHRLDRLHEVEDWIIRETQEEIIIEEFTAVMFQFELFGLVPGVGIISGGLLNLAFLSRVEETSRRAFQERWLRDNCKIDHIEPALQHPRLLVTGWAGAFGRVVDAGCFALGFGMTLPILIAGKRLRPRGVVQTRMNS